MKIDYCIIGLGNPGLRYKNTRHNIGFIIIDKLSEYLGVKKFKTKNSIWQRYKYKIAIAEFCGKRLLLIKPLTYMNNSGNVVNTVVKKYDLPYSNIIVIYDDVSLKLGELRLRPSGSDGGHKGMASVINKLESENIPRLRVGIRNQEELHRFETAKKYDLTEYVLSEFTLDEKKKLNEIITLVKDAVLCIIKDGFANAMSSYNKKLC